MWETALIIIILALVVVRVASRRLIETYFEEDPAEDLMSEDWRRKDNP